MLPHSIVNLLTQFSIMEDEIGGQQIEQILWTECLNVFSFDYLRSDVTMFNAAVKATA